MPLSEEQDITLKVKDLKKPFLKNKKKNLIIIIEVECFSESPDTIIG